MSHPSTRGKVLFHTDYFNEPAIATSLADEIAAVLMPPYAAVAIPTSPPFPQRKLRPRVYAVQYQFIAALCRILTVAASVAAPAMFLGWCGYVFLYPWSRDFVVNWAIRAPLIQAAITADTASPSAAPSRTTWIEYLAALPDEKARERLLEATRSASSSTVLYWTIEYATRVTARDSSRLANAQELLVTVANNILDGRQSDRTLVAYAYASIKWLQRLTSQVSPELLEASERLHTALPAEAIEFVPGFVCQFASLAETSLPLAGDDARKSFLSGQYAKCLEEASRLARISRQLSLRSSFRIRPTTLKVKAKEL